MNETDFTFTTPYELIEKWMEAKKTIAECEAKLIQWNPQIITRLNEMICIYKEDITNERE